MYLVPGGVLSPGGVFAQCVSVRGVSAQVGVCLGGVCLGGCLPGGVSAQGVYPRHPPGRHPPPVNRMNDRHV